MAPLITRLLILCLFAASPVFADADDSDSRDQAQKLLKFQYEQIIQGTARPAHYHAFLGYLTAERERYEIAAKAAEDAGKDDKAYQIKEYAKWFGYQEALVQQMLAVEADKVRLVAQGSAESRQSIKALSGKQEALAASLAAVRANPPKR